jgi:(E)-4-hydroxy-3-methylbut-2-enyl-diphosphate synthase
MIQRRKTRTVSVGTVRLGHQYPVAVQSMTKVLTTDVAACVRQVKRLAEAGCALVRIAVPTRADTEAFAKIVQKSPVPLVADIHFSPERAIEALEGGAAKIRLNPGNIKDRKDILRIIDCAKRHGAAIRAGVNEASIRDLKTADVRQDKRVTLMLKEMKQYVRLFEKAGFDNLVLSAKSADTVRTIAINRAMAETFDYPIHVGLTHAGLLEDAQTPSAVAIGTLLAEGIGDTIRVSIAGDPVVEARLGHDILTALGLSPRQGPELIVCPTCGRCEVDVRSLAKKVRKLLQEIHQPVRVAVMGCVVNGPGEAADADVAVCAGKGKGFIYRGGQKIAAVEEAGILDALRREITAITAGY